MAGVAVMLGCAHHAVNEEQSAYAASDARAMAIRMAPSSAHRPSGREESLRVLDVGLVLIARPPLAGGPLVARARAAFGERIGERVARLAHRVLVARLR